jgi:hypothetical protein
MQPLRYFGGIVRRSTLFIGLGGTFEWPELIFWNNLIKKLWERSGIGTRGGICSLFQSPSTVVRNSFFHDTPADSQLLKLRTQQTTGSGRPRTIIQKAESRTPKPAWFRKLTPVLM